MHRNVTAVYRNAVEAETARRELAAIGVSEDDIRIVPDEADRVAEVGLVGETATADALRALDLPQDDLSRYERQLRAGGVLVSVSVDPALVARVEDILQKPGDLANLRQAGVAPLDPAPATPSDADLPATHTDPAAPALRR